MIKDTILQPKSFTGERCDFYLKIKRCLKRHNLQFFWNFSWNCLAEINCWKRIQFCDPKILQVKDVTITWILRGVLNDTIWIIGNLGFHFRSFWKQLISDKQFLLKLTKILQIVSFKTPLNLQVLVTSFTCKISLIAE